MRLTQTMIDWSPSIMLAQCRKTSSRLHMSVYWLKCHQVLPVPRSCDWFWSTLKCTHLENISQWSSVANQFGCHRLPIAWRCFDSLALKTIIKPIHYVGIFGWTTFGFHMMTRCHYNFFMEIFLQQWSKMLKLLIPRMTKKMLHPSSKEVDTVMFLSQDAFTNVVAQVLQVLTMYLMLHQHLQLQH